MIGICKDVIIQSNISNVFFYDKDVIQGIGIFGVVCISYFCCMVQFRFLCIVIGFQI